MAIKMTVQVRLTDRYVDTCSHMDSWGQRFEVKVLQPRLLPQRHDEDEGSYIMRVIGPKNVNQKLLKQAISNSMNRHGCTHTYDCCGCLSISAAVTKMRKGVFSVHTSHSRNY